MSKNCCCENMRNSNISFYHPSFEFVSICNRCGKYTAFTIMQTNFIIFWRSCLFFTSVCARWSRCSNNLPEIMYYLQHSIISEEQPCLPLVDNMTSISMTKRKGVRFSFLLSSSVPFAARYLFFGCYDLVISFFGNSYTIVQTDNEVSSLFINVLIFLSHQHLQWCYIDAFFSYGDKLANGRRLEIGDNEW